MERQRRPQDSEGDDIEQMLVKQHQEVAKKQAEEKTAKLQFTLKPKDVKAILDRDVIGQDDAKKYLSNAVCYHYARLARMETVENGGDTSIKKNVLMIGPTGVGKTYLVSKISKIVGVPFVKADATKYSATGYVGGDVEDMIRDLYIAADKNLELAECGMVYIDEIDKIRGGEVFGKDVSGAEVQRGLLKLMEETEVDIKSQGGGNLMEQLGACAPHREDPQKPKKNADKINTRHILFIVSGAFSGLEKIVMRRLGPEVNGDWSRSITAQDLVDYGMEPEFVGRLPIMVGLKDLNEEDLYKILKFSGDSIIKQYVRDFESYGIKASFTDEALKVFAGKAAQHKTGARALAGVIEDSLIDFLYELPSTEVKELVIDKALVENPRLALANLVFDQEVNAYRKDFGVKHGISLKFDKDAYSMIKQKFVEEKADVKEYCNKMLERYVHALKLYGQEEFVVVPEVVKDPAGYLKTILRGKETDAK